MPGSCFHFSPVTVEPKLNCLPNTNYMYYYFSVNVVMLHHILPHICKVSITLLHLASYVTCFQIYFPMIQTSSLGTVYIWPVGYFQINTKLRIWSLSFGYFVEMNVKEQSEYLQVIFILWMPLLWCSTTQMWEHDLTDQLLLAIIKTDQTDYSTHKSSKLGVSDLICSC